MIFNSFQFIWLFPLIFLVYWGGYSVGNRFFKKLPQILLLAISYGLYMQWNPAYALILFGVTLVTFFGGLIVEKYRGKGVIYIGVLLTLLPLLVFKYYNFITNAGASVLANIGIDAALLGLNWVVPLGLSFYTFQSLGYLWDVYYKHLKAERNLLDYMLFVSFFPQILCGPISQAKDLLPQIKTPAAFNYDRAVSGLRYILFGLLLKVVIADRIGIYVDTIYSDYPIFSGTTCILAAALYSFQIYGDFAGYSYLALGVARMLGFEIINNFNRPYFATSVSEFWKRWNISLTMWLTKYIYIPLGGSRRGMFRTYLNIMVTFLVSGIWHGANYTFIIWGSIHGVVQCIEKALGLNKIPSKLYYVVPRIIITFIIVTLAWVFFRMPTVEDTIAMIGHMFSNQGEIFMNKTILVHVAIGLCVLFLIEIPLEYRHRAFTAFIGRHPVVRWAGYLFLTVLVLSFGVLDSSQFIYAIF